MARRLPFGAGILAATLLVSACSGSGGAVSAGGELPGSTHTNGAGSNSSSAGGSSTSGGGSSTQGGGGGGGGQGSDGFAYTPWGPNDPPIPEQYAAFATGSAKNLNCAAVATMAAQARFWDVAADVCRGLKEGHGWPATKAVPKLPKADNAYQDCLNRELASMLERALRWHAANPGRQPVIRYPRRSSTSPCQSRIYGVKLLPSTDPDSSAGKIAVAITAPTGKNGEDFFVTVDGQPSDQGDVERDSVSDGLQKAVILLDPPAHDRDVLVVVDNGRGRRTATVHLTATSTSASPAGSPSPSETGNGTGSNAGSNHD